MASPSAAEVRALFRQFLRLGRTFPNYNIKHYIQRKTREELRGLAQGGQQAEGAAAAAAWQAAQADLQAFQRQAVVYGMYGRKLKNVLELKEAAAKRQS